MFIAFETLTTHCRFSYQMLVINICIKIARCTPCIFFTFIFLTVLSLLKLIFDTIFLLILYQTFHQINWYKHLNKTFKRHLGTLCFELNTIRGVSLKSLFNDITVRSADTYLSLNLCDFETLLKIQLLPFAVNEFEYFSYKKKMIAQTKWHHATHKIYKSVSFDLMICVWHRSLYHVTVIVIYIYSSIVSILLAQHSYAFHQ